MAWSAANTAAAGNHAGRARQRRGQAALRLRTLARRALRRARRAAAAVTVQSLVASGLTPVAVAAGGAAAVSAAAAVATHAPAQASISGSVLILSTSVNGGTSSGEAQAASALGLSVTVATPSTWDAMTTAQFQAYTAIVIGDPSTTTCSSTVPSDALSTAGTWGAAVNGNVAVLGTAPALGGASTLISDAIAYAASGGSGKTGLYVSLNCEDSTDAAGTSVPLLASVEGGGFTATGQGANCPSDAGTVNTWQALALAQFNGLTSGKLGPWSSPACSVQETFNDWPAGLAGLAYYAAASPATFTASDGATGQAYILAGAPVPAATAALAPSTGGQVPAGATAGGGSNPAAPGVAQATAADPVNTENGDFTQSATDLSIPTFGPSLDFTRSYDAQTAQQQTQTGTPGPMGYGWADNWASSLSAAKPVPGDIYTLDGLGTGNGNGGPPGSAVLDSPGTMIQDSSGNVYIADTAGNRVQEIPASSGSQWGQSMTAGDVYTIAGSPVGTPGASGNGTAAGSSLLRVPAGLAVDSSGDLYIADSGNNRVLEVPPASGTKHGISMTANDIYVIAGTGTSGTGADGIAATSSALADPVGISMGNGTNAIYIADVGNNRIQEIPSATGSQWGQSMTAFDVYTVAGSAAGTGGNSGDSGAAASALLRAPEGVTISSAGDLYVADTGNNRIREVAKATGTEWNISMTANDIYNVAGNSSGTAGTSGDGGVATSAYLDGPDSVSVYNTNMYIADSLNNRIQEVARTTHTEWGISMTAFDAYTIAGSASGTAGFSGDGGAATSATLSDPQNLFMGSSMYVLDTGNNRIRQVDSAGTITEYAGNGVALPQDGNGGPAVTAALNNPGGEAFDAAGDVFIADAGNNRIQEIAATTHTQYGITMTAGDVYTIAGQANGTSGHSGDGGAATSAFLNTPESVAEDTAGNLYIADTSNCRIQKVSTSGTMSTVAGSSSGTCGISGDGGAATSAQLAGPQGVAVDSQGDLYIADTLNNRIQEVFASGGQSFGQTMTAGDIYTIAGSATGTAGHGGNGDPATSAQLNNPQGVAVDGAGNLYIADTLNNRVQEVPVITARMRGRYMTAYRMYTDAGSPTGLSGSTGDGGPALSSLLHAPSSATVNAAGDIYISDSANNRIQEAPVANGTQWAQPMTANYIYTVAGSATGTSGNSGDGGPATSALINTAQTISLDPAGDLYITDASNNRLREVTSATAPTITPAPGLTSALYPAPGGLTITQPAAAQVTFYAQTGGNCPSPYVLAGQYCTLPENVGASLTYNSGNGTYTFTPQPGTSYTYNTGGNLTSMSDAAGNTLNASYGTPLPGSGNCPSGANWCQTITSASGRALMVGYNASNLVTSVTDPMGRKWSYGYTSSDLTSVTDPMGNVTSYTYGAGSTGNPLNANNLLTITKPNAQPGGPDAGDATVNVYDSSGRVTSQTDPMGYKTTFDYSQMNASTGNGVVTVADPDGNKTVYDYSQGDLAAQSAWTGSTLTSEQDNLPAQSGTGASAGTQLNTATADGDGNITTYTYDVAGNPITTTAPDGIGSQFATTTQQSTGLDNPDCTSDQTASSTCSQSAGPTPVAPGGTITPPSSIPPQGVTWTLYDTDGNELWTTTGVYPPGSGTASYAQTTYQLFKGNSITLNGNNITCSATPPSQSLPCATINADGVVTQLAYNSSGDLTSSSTPDGNGSEVAKTTYSYDGDGEQTATTSPDGNLSGANAGNYTTTTAYNNDRQKASVTQAGGTGATVTPRTTSYGYDADGNQKTVQDARSYTTTTTFNADDQSTLVTDPDGHATLTCYDGAGNVTQTVPPAGVATNNLTPSSCPGSYPSGYGNRLASDATTDTYDANGNKTQETTPAPAGQTGSETTTYTYDPNGNLSRSTAPPTSNGGPNQVTVDTYTSTGKVATETTGYGTSAASTISYCYDPNGDQTSVVYPDGNTSGTATCETAYPWVVSSSSYPTQASYQTTSGYDSAGELVTTTSPTTSAAPSGATTTSTYDPAGNKLTSKDPNGVTTTSTYTPLDKTATVTYSGNSAHALSFGYDANGNRTSMSDATGSTNYVYDPFGELTSTTNGANQTGYGYDADGNATSITYPLPASATWATSNTVTYSYDHADLLTGVTDFNGNQITTGNTPDGMPTSVGLGSTGDTITTTYDNTDMPQAIALKNNGGSTLQSFTYSHAPAGTILSETDTPSSPQSPAVYTYDAKSRVTSMTPGSGSALNYRFDASSNLTTLPTGATGTYDKAGELASSTMSGTTTSYTYNADGERLTAQQGTATVASATWDGAAELASYADSAENMSAATYNGDGLRATATTGAGTQDFVWDASRPLPQLIMDSRNAYIYCGSCSGLAPAEQVNLATGNVTYLTTDELGSVRGAVNSSGTLTGTASYDAWGNPQTSGGLTGTTPFGYAGGYTDPTGLIYLINRYYDASTGQFLSVDPNLRQTLAPYSYADGNPVSRTDPSGLYSCAWTHASRTARAWWSSVVLRWTMYISFCFNWKTVFYVHWHTEPWIAWYAYAAGWGYAGLLWSPESYCYPLTSRLCSGHIVEAQAHFRYCSPIRVWCTREWDPGLYAELTYYGAAWWWAF